MRLLISIIDWEYPTSKDNTQPALWDLQNQNRLIGLALVYGNGVILELRAEGDSEEAVEILRGIAIGTGSSTRVEIS